MPFVLDASVTMSWCFHDEATPATWRVLDSLDEDLAYVPSIWILEIANTLNMARRKGWLGLNQYLRFIQTVRELPINVDQPTVERVLTVVPSMASAQQLTTYDAAYLELAVRMGLPIATTDARLAQTASRLGLRLLP